MALTSSSAICCATGLAIAVVLAWSNAAHAADTDDAGAEIVQICNECHGEGGSSDDPNVPSIGGFSEFAIMDLLETYRTGQRPAQPAKRRDGSETDMVEIAQGLTEAEIEAVAYYYAQQTWRPHAQPHDVAQARRGARVHAVKCGKCHLKGGSIAEADLAITAGQWREYLQAQFRRFDAGTRPMSDKMRRRYESLSASDKLAIIEFYVGGAALATDR